MIAEMLKEGKKNKITFAELKERTEMSERALRKQIADERRQGALILATKEGTGGYYLPKDQAEAKAYCDSMTKEAKSILFTLKSCKKYIKTDPMQCEISI